MNFIFMNTAFSSYFLPVTLAVITLGMGLSVTLKDFKNIFLRPKAVITGISCQLLLLPAIAFTVASLTNINPYFKVGLVIIAACPGGATSNLVTYILKGNVALSISMTALNSLVTLISIPFYVSMALLAFIHTDASITLPVGNTVLKIFLVTIVPAYAGIMIRKRYTRLADKLEEPLRYILPLILLVVYAGVIFIDEGGGGESATRSDFINLFPYTLLLNATAMFMGWMIARLVRLGRRNQFTISIEVGLQNSALAIFVASTLLENRLMALVAVVYGSFTFFSTALFGYLIKRVTTGRGVKNQ